MDKMVKGVVLLIDDKSVNVDLPENSPIYPLPVSGTQLELDAFSAGDPFGGSLWRVAVASLWGKMFFLHAKWMDFPFFNFWGP